MRSTLGKVIDRLKKASFTADYSREEIVDRINEIRNFLWSFKSGRKSIFTDDGCVKVEKFNSCTGSCAAWYGIGLPADVQQVTSLRLNGKKVPIYAEETKAESVASRCCDCHCQCHCGDPVAVDMGNRFLTEHDPKCEDLWTIRGSRKDEQLEAGVEYVHNDTTPLREDVEIGGSTTYPVRDMISLTLPYDREDWIEIYSADDVIARVHPSISAPSFRRLSTHNIPEGCELRWWGILEPFDVKFDTDRVEIDDPHIWKSLFLGLDLHYQTNRNISEERTYRSMMEVVRGLLDQHLDAKTPAGRLMNIRPRTRAQKASQYINRPPRQWQF